MRKYVRRMTSRLAARAESTKITVLADAFAAPWLVIRALSDLAGEDSHLDFHAFVHTAARNAAAAVLKTLPLFDGA